MSLENIRQLGKGLLNEGLNRNVYQRIIKDIELVIELEVIYENDLMGGDDLSSGQDSYLDDIYIGDDADSFNAKIVEFNDYIDTIYHILGNQCFDYLHEKTNIYLPNDVEELDTNISGDSHSLLNEQKSEIDKRLNECETIIEDYNKYLKIFKDIPDEAWIDDTGLEGEELLEAKQKDFEDFLLYVHNLSNILDTLKSLKAELLMGIEMIIEQPVSDNIGNGSGRDSDESQADLVMNDIEHTGPVRLMREMDEFDISGKRSWEFVDDGSLSSGGVEMVSPVVSYKNFIDYIPRICTSLAENGFHADKSCGYHIGLSSSSFSLPSLISDTIEHYGKLGYNKLTSTIIATQQGYKTVFRHNNPERDESYRYTISLLDHVIFATSYQDSMTGDTLDAIKNSSLDDLLHSNKFDASVAKFRIEKFTNVNRLHNNKYIELRVLGGVEGFEILKDENKLKRYLYDAISQVYGAVDFDKATGEAKIKEMSANEIVKLMDFYLRKVRQEREPDNVYKQNREAIKLRNNGGL